MAITIDDFNKVWASTSPLTPYEFSEANYKEGWNFIGGAPPSRQMWDFIQKQNDEKLKYLLNNFDDYAKKTDLDDYAKKTDFDDYAKKTDFDDYAKKTDLDDYLPLAGGTLTGDVLGVTPPNGDNSKKLANTEFIQALASILVPIGCVQAFAGNTTPQGWLLCDGSAVSRTQYSRLFGVIGTTYGAGDGTDTFNLPDMSGRVAIGSGTGTDANSTSKTFTLGDSDGEYTHKLIVAEMPSHKHKFEHWGASAGNNGYISGASSFPYGEAGMGMTNAGGDAYHNNIQPYTVLRYIIKY